MNRVARALVAIGWLSGCGAPGQSETQPEKPHLVGLLLNEPMWSDGTTGARAPGEIGQTAESLLVPKEGLSQVGTRPGSLQSCEVGNTGQDCVVPAGGAVRADGTRYKEIRYFVGGTNANPVRAWIQTWVNAVCLTASPPANCGYCVPGVAGCNNHDKYYITEATSATDPTITLKFSVTSSANGACGGSAGNVTDELCFSGFTESIAVVGLEGGYHYWTEAPVATIDYGHIQAITGLSQASRDRLVRQATFAALDIAIGRGLGGEPFPQCSQVFETPNATCTLPVNTTCIMNNGGDYGNRALLTELASPDCGN